MLALAAVRLDHIIIRTNKVLKQLQIVFCFVNYLECVVTSTHMYVYIYIF